MDGFECIDVGIIIAARNRPDVLDAAVLRPGRFDRQVVVSNPDIIGREKILKVHVKKIKMAPDVNLRTVARGTPGFSGADLANLVNEAALLAAQRAEENTTLAKFMRNLESRIFAQLSKQLVEQLFSGEGSTFGSFMIDGNMITYEQTICNPATMACTEGEDVIIMTIVDPNGSQTVIIIPIGTGTFAGTGDG